MTTTPFEIERLVIGAVLKFGNEAAHVAMPALTPDKFIFDTDGSFGSAHELIWRVLFDTFMNEHLSPTVINVMANFTGNTLAYIQECANLPEQQGLVPFNVQEFSSLCGMVDKAGIVYRVTSQFQPAVLSLHNVQSFMRTVHQIPDIDQWLAGCLNDLRGVSTMRGGGYVHVGSVMQSVRDKWERIVSGVESPLVPNGFPSLEKRRLFPRGKFAVLHGLSGSGKSSFVFQINLAAAIYLYENNLPGCVAINTLEMEQEDLVEKMASILAQVDISKLIDNSIKKAELDRLSAWSEYVERLPLFIDNTKFVTTDALQYRASGLHVSQYGPVIQLSSDYGELFSDKGDSEEQRVNAIFRNQFHLSRAIGASVIAISQSTADKRVSGLTYIAGADGTRYSRAIFMGADIVAELWNPVAIETSGRAVEAPIDAATGQPISKNNPWLLIQKYRNARAGGMIPLGWMPETTTFYDLDLNFTGGSGPKQLFSFFSTTTPPAVTPPPPTSPGGW